MDWVGLLSGLLALAGALLKVWLDNSPARLKEKQDAERQKVRSAIAAGAVTVLNSELDQLLPAGSMPTEGSTDAGSPAGQHSGSDTATEIGNILGAKVVLRQ